jgi:head-tail adaptor
MTDKSLASQLIHRIAAYGKVEFKNELGEKDYRYEKIKSIWSRITALSGSVKDGDGHTEYADITHRITIRVSAIELTKDMYFIYKGQRYDVKYFNPNYKYKDRIEIMVSLVVE